MDCVLHAGSMTPFPIRLTISAFYAFLEICLGINYSVVLNSIVMVIVQNLTQLS